MSRAAARRVAWASLLGVCVCSAELTAPFTYDAPEFFREPLISRARMSTTYSYLAQDGKSPLRLTITAMPTREVRDGFGALTPGQCTDLFVDALRATHARFFVSAQTRLLTLGTSPLTQRRWTGEKAGTALTGIVACTEINGHYYAIDFVDELRAAARSFPSIRESLRGFNAVRNRR